MEDAAIGCLSFALLLVLLYGAWVRADTESRERGSIRRRDDRGALEMRKATLIATLMAAVSAFSSPAKAQAPLKIKPSAKSNQPTYMITAHTVVHDDSTNSQLDNYVIVYGSEVLTVQYAESQISTVKPGASKLEQAAPGKNLHLHARYASWPQEPDVSQVPHIGVPIRACEMDTKYPDSDGHPVIAIQSVSSPCMSRNGDTLHYSIEPNGGIKMYEYVNFDILEATNNVGVVAAQSAPPKLKPSVEPIYVITAHTVGVSKRTHLDVDFYTITYGSLVLKLEFDKSVYSSYYQLNSNVSQMPQVGVPIRACKMTTDFPGFEGRPFVATQLTNDPCIARNGDMLQYNVAPNGGKHGHECATFDILEATNNVGVVAAQSAQPRKDIPAIAKAANGAIVSIIMSDKDGHPIAQGSGFLISNDGVIMTNYHVIAEGSSAVVKFPDGAFHGVDGVLASDKARDIAVIRAHGQNFRTLPLGNSDQVQVGEEVVAIGNPLSLESTVSNGIVSGIRSVEEEGGKFLQITAPISPGSSGGPLFNMAGEVIGITTMYLKGGENLNFAIPINDAKRLLLDQSTTIQALPSETVPVQAQTPDAAMALNWISSHMLPKALHTMPGVNGTTVQMWETSSLSFQGCQVTIYEETIGFTVFRSGEKYGSGTSMITWGPFDLSNLRPDKIFQAPDKNYQPPGAYLQIEAVNAIPTVQTGGSGPTTTLMLSGLHIWFNSADLVDRQAKAWHDAIVGCGGKPTPDPHAY